MTDLSVGLVITHYDRPWHLELILQAWLAQGMPSEHIVVVDDASSQAREDKIRDVCSLYKVFFIKVMYPLKEVRASQCMAIGDAFIQTDVIIASCDDYLPSNTFYKEVLDIYNRPEGCEYILSPVLWAINPEFELNISSPCQEFFKRIERYYFDATIKDGSLEQIQTHSEIQSHKELWDSLKRPDQGTIFAEPHVISSKENMIPYGHNIGDGVVVYKKDWGLRWEPKLISGYLWMGQFLELAKAQNIKSVIIKELEAIHLQPVIDHGFSNPSRVGYNLNYLLKSRRSYYNYLKGLR